MDYLHFKEFGKGFIKTHKISPDSFIQIALQYTFLRLHGVPGAHYESAHTRLFVHGRTETIRSCSNDSVAFAKSMMESGTNEDRVEKLLAAIKAHKDYTMLAMQGKGVDRHLLGLKLTAQENNMKVPELFSDVGYVKSSHMRLSTSQVASKYEAYMCYGPLVDNGYGCCYNPREDDMLFGISAFNSCPETSAKKFSVTLKESLMDIIKMNWIAQKSITVLSNPSSRYLAANSRNLSSFDRPVQGMLQAAVQHRNSSSHGGKSLENPQNLPPLPVPSLKETLTRFLTTVQPHLNEEEFRRTRSIVDKFSQPGNDGETLQKLLEARAGLKSNWLAEWWLKTAYLGYRDPVVVWSSPGIVFPERTFSSERDRLSFAAKIITACLKFKAEIDNDRIPVEKFGKNELDMQQYRKIFGTCRIPGREIDTIEFNPKSKHIVVLHQGNIYKVPVYGGSGQDQLLNEEELIEQLQECVKASLAETQKALFVLSLDDAVPRPSSYKTVTSHQVIHGGGSKQNAGNR
uniref:Choline/carnitine acyltransferase domain-containing protein n=1 Tax=Phlebotomus papatasi TaxID=29031 RepID=A0A1B0DQY5_PHLPP